MVVSINLGLRLGASAGKDKEAGDQGQCECQRVGNGDDDCRHVMGRAEPRAYTEGLKTGNRHAEGIRDHQDRLGQSWSGHARCTPLSGKAMDKAEVDKLKRGDRSKCRRARSSRCVDAGARATAGSASA